MNLLAAANYDPTGGAVTKATTGLQAMTAFDTTNLRLAFTVPSHGMVHVRMSCVHHGATTIAQLFLGCLESATLRGRAVPTPNLLGTSIAAALVKLEVAFTITGLTPGAVNWDAAYGVETVANAGGIKYGGANNTSGNDAFGGFNFEIWDPRPFGVTQTAGDIVALINAVDDLIDTEVAAIKTETASIQTDTNDIQARLPAALGANGNLKADIRDYNGTAGTFASGRPEVNTTHLAGQAVTAAAGVTFPTSVASPTNITAGTITTATNVTTVNGLAANVITAASMAADTSAEIADAVWDELKAGHTVADSFGDYLDDEITSRATAADVPSAAVVADAVWDEDATNHQTTGSFGAAIGDPGADTVSIYYRSTQILIDTDSIDARLPAALSGDGFMKADLKSIEDELTSGNNATLNLKQLNVANDAGAAAIINGSTTAVSLVAGASSAVYVEGGTGGYGFEVYAGSGSNADAIYLGGDGTGKSVNAPQNIAVSDGNLTLAAIRDAVWAKTIETGYTALQSTRLMLSALAGKLSGAATTTVTIRNAADSKNRIVATVDSDGNRSAVTHDTTD